MSTSGTEEEKGRGVPDADARRGDEAPGATEVAPLAKVAPLAEVVPLGEIAREWGRIGCVGFGGPPTHIALLRELCVTKRGWLSDAEMQDAIAASGLLPGPASTQLAIFCAWRLRGASGALIGGACFIVPGLIAILGLAALFLSSSPPAWVRGAGAGAGAAVAAVAVNAGLALLPSSWAKAPGSMRPRWAAYLLLGAIASATVGPWLVLVLLGCGALETAWRGGSEASGRRLALLAPLELTARGAAAEPATARWRAARLGTAGAVAAGTGTAGAIAWVAVKVGALSYGGGFVIVPLMQSDAVSKHHWMTGAEFLSAVALGQVTPGPVTHTVAVVGYAAAGVAGGLLAAAVAFVPSFAFVLLGGGHFDALRRNGRARAFLGGAGPAAVGAILGSAIPLALELRHGWQLAVLAAAAVALLGLRRGVVATLLASGAVGMALALSGVAVT